MFLFKLSEWLIISVVLFLIGYFAITYLLIRQRKLKDKLRLSHRQVKTLLAADTSKFKDARESEFKYLSLFEASNNAILILDGFTITDCNKATCRVFNCDQEKIAGKDFRNLIFDQESAASGKNQFEELLKKAMEGTSQIAELTLLKKNAEPFISEVKLSQFEFWNKIYFFITITDINERKRIEGELEQYRSTLEEMVVERTEELESVNEKLSSANDELFATNVRLKSVIENLEQEIESHRKTQADLAENKEMLNAFIQQSSEGFALLNESGEVLVWNAELARITGLESEEILDIKIWDIPQISSDFDGHEKSDPLKSYIQNYLEQQYNYHLNGIHNIRDKKGIPRITESILYPVKTTANVYFGLIVKDITAKKEVENMLLEYQNNLESMIQEKTMEIIKNEALFKTIVENFPFEFWVLDKECRVTYMNPVSVNSWGDLTGMIHDEFPVSEEIKAKWKDTDNRVLSGELVVDEVNYTIGDQKVYYHVVSSPLIVMEEIQGLVGVAFDITPLRETQEQVKQSEEKFERIFNTSLDIITVIDWETGKYVDINEYYIQTTGYENRNEIIGRTREEVGVWPDENQRKNFLDMLAKYGYVHNLEMQWKLGNGEKRWYLLSAEFIELNNKRFLLTISRDINEIYVLSEQLRKSEEKFRNIFNSSRDIILISSFDQKIFDINQYSCELTGFSIDELKQRTVIDFIPCEFHKGIKDRLEQLNKGYNIPIYDFEVVVKDNRVIPVEMKSILIDYEDDKAILSIIRDVSDRKITERKIRELSIYTEEKERQKLATDLHDEVGPLLSSMNMYLSTLKRKPEIQKYAENIETISAILAETIMTVREISNNLSPHLLANYGLISALNSFFETKRSLINIKFTCNRNEFNIHKTLEIAVYRIIKELFNNSLKYAKASDININLVIEDKFVKLTYADNGVGFDFDNILKNSKTGMGLISITNRVDALGGRYSIKTSPDNGFRLIAAFDLS